MEPKPINPERDCLGCEQDFYNGKNPYGVQQCWSVPKAKIIKVKPISIEQEYPSRYLKKVKWQKRPHCYQRKRMHYAKVGEYGL